MLGRDRVIPSSMLRQSRQSAPKRSSSHVRVANLAAPQQTSPSHSWIETPPRAYVQHWMFVPPGHNPAVLVPLHVALSWHVPAPLLHVPYVQHWLSAPPGHKPLADAPPTRAHEPVDRHSPSAAMHLASAAAPGCSEAADAVTQHCTSLGLPGHRPGVAAPRAALHDTMRMQVPPLAAHRSPSASAALAVQHWTSAAPGQSPGVEDLPAALQAKTRMHVPPLDVHLASSSPPALAVQHWTSAAPGHRPGVVDLPAAVHAATRMHVPPLDVHLASSSFFGVQHWMSAFPGHRPGVAVPSQEDLLLQVPPVAAHLDVSPATLVQHWTSAAPGQRPGVAVPVHDDVFMQVPPFAVQRASAGAPVPDVACGGPLPAVAEGLVLGAPPPSRPTPLHTPPGRGKSIVCGEMSSANFSQDVGPTMSSSSAKGLLGWWMSLASMSSSAPALKEPWATKAYFLPSHGKPVGAVGVGVSP